jgi:hypothetical protein
MLETYLVCFIGLPNFFLNEPNVIEEKSFKICEWYIEFQWKLENIVKCN